MRLRFFSGPGGRRLSVGRGEGGKRGEYRSHLERTGVVAADENNLRVGKEKRLKERGTAWGEEPRRGRYSLEGSIR